MKTVVVNYCTNVFIHEQLHVALSRETLLNRLTLLLFSSTLTVREDIVFPTVFPLHTLKKYYLYLDFRPG